jgi:predicted nucleic acid-binding protein
MLNQIRRLAVVIESLPDVDCSQDPSDNFLLAIAQAGRAEYLVSGDKRHVLSLSFFGATRIVTARQFLEVLGL